VRWRNRFDEPIDFALLAAERRGYRHTPETLKRIKATRAKNRKARARVAAKRTEERLSEARAPRRGTPGAGQRFLDAFERGKWYGVSDIETRAGIKRGSAKAYSVKFRELGWIERTKNPAFERPGGLECEFLFRRIRWDNRDLNSQVQDQIGDKGDGAGQAADQ
jgi:hypothetical protein